MAQAGLPFRFRGGVGESGRDDPRNAGSSHMLAQLTVGQGLRTSCRRPRRPDPAPAGRRRRTCPHPAGWARRSPRGSRSWGRCPSPARYGSWGRPSTTALAYSAMRQFSISVGSRQSAKSMASKLHAPTQRPQPTQCVVVDVHLAGLSSKCQTVVGALPHGSGGSRGRFPALIHGLAVVVLFLLAGTGAAAHAQILDARRRSRSSRGP